MSFYQGDIAFVVHCSKFERKCFCGQTADKLTPDSSHSFGQVCILLVVLLAQRWHMTLARRNFFSSVQRL